MNKISNIMNKILNGFSISKIMTLFSLIIIIFIVVNGWFVASTAENQVREEIEQGLRDQVNAAAATINNIIIDSDYDITLAKPQIVTFMDSFRWGEGGSGYLFINETQSNTQVHHTFKPETDGQRTFNATLLNGGTFEQATQEVTRSQEAKLVHYSFDNPATGKPEVKATYIVPLKQPDWVLSAGVYISRADNAFMTVIKQILIGTSVLLVCVIFLIVIISGYFKHKIGSMQKELQHKFGDNVIKSTDVNEMTQLEHGVDVLLTMFNRVIEVLGDSSSRVAGAAAKQQILSQSATKGMADQKQKMEEIATAMNEMVATVSEVASNSACVADEISRIEDLARSGESSMQQTANSIADLSSELTVSGNVVEQLAQDSKQIESVLDVISNLADQTNLLALNAAIEAARAGDHGRGFAVVADEVRELARKTTLSTSEIREMIELLQKRVSEVVLNIASSIENAKTSVDIASDSQAQMSAITSLLEAVSDMTTQIATAAEEQSSVNEDMNKNINAVKMIAYKTYDQVGDTNKAAEGINELIKQVHNETSKIKVKDPVYHISQAKIAHQLWLSRINNFLENKEHLHEEEGTCHKSCQLGQWYTKEALTEFKDIPGVKELDKPHKEFHDKIKELIKAKTSGKLNEAENTYKELIHISEQVVENLDLIYKNIDDYEKSLTGTASVPSH